MKVQTFPRLAFIPIFGWVCFISTQPDLLAQISDAPTIIDMEERRASVVHLKTYIEQREQRLSEMGGEIVALDSRIANRVDHLVKMLTGLKDSQESRTKVSNLKLEAMQGLERGLALYASKRREIGERIKKGDQSSLGDLQKFDERMTGFVDDMVLLAKSFPAHQDVDRYERTDSSYWRGYYTENVRVNEEWKQSRRDDSKNQKARDEGMTFIKETLEKLDQRKRTLQDLLDHRNPTEAERTLYLQELGSIGAHEDHLQSQLDTMTWAVGESEGRVVGLHEAIDITKSIEDARRDLRSDVSRLFHLYDEFAAERARLAAQKENLAARIEWLEKNDKGAQ